MKPDPVLVNDLKAILDPVVAARGRPDRRTPGPAGTPGTGGSGETAGSPPSTGRSAGASRGSGPPPKLLAGLADLPEAAERLESWLRDADPAWRAEVIALSAARGSPGSPRC